MRLHEWLATAVGLLLQIPLWLRAAAGKTMRSPFSWGILFCGALSVVLILSGVLSYRSAASSGKEDAKGRWLPIVAGLILLLATFPLVPHRRFVGPLWTVHQLLFDPPGG